MRSKPTYFIALCIIFFLSGCSIYNVMDGSSTNKKEADSISDMNRNGSEETYIEASTEQSSPTASLAESSSEADEFKPDFNNIMEIMEMDKDSVVKRLGNDYEIVIAGLEDQQERYKYSKLGITLTFSPSGTSEKIAIIFCNEMVDIKGAKNGMTFTKIQEILGKCDPVGDEDYGYHISYEFNGVLVWFWAKDKNSPTHDLQIRRYTMPQ